MSRLRPSFKAELLAAMALTAAAAFAGTSFTVTRIEHAEEQSIVRHDAAEAADAIARLADAGATDTDFRRLQAALGDDQLLVYRGGTRVFAGPARRSELTAVVSRPYLGGRVVVVGHADENPRRALELALTIAAAVLLMTGAGTAIALVLARSVRRPLERAIVAADRVASGDLNARMGASGSDEFARLGRAFDGMAQRLEEQDLDQRRFLADVAHEIATPVNAISGFALALADGSAATPAERSEAGEMIVRETHRLESLLGDLRRLTRLDLAESTERRRVDVRAVCEDLVARLRPAAAAAGIRVSVAAAEIHVTSDPRLLETILLNLLTNAIRYTPRGGTVDVTARRRRTEVVIAVRDTGIGIAPEHQTRIFDRLYRIDEARDRGSGGSGLGLAIAQRAARTLGGRIELESSIDAGSEFRLVVPYPRSETTRSEPAAAGG